MEHCKQESKQLLPKKHQNILKDQPMPNKLIYSIFSFLSVAGLSSAASAIQLCGQPAQGEILQGRADNISRIVMDGKDIRLSPQGNFLIVFGRDETSPKQFAAATSSGEVIPLSVDVNKTAWDVQSLKGVPPRKVTPSDSDLRDIEREQKLVRAGQAENTATPYWQKGFIQPVEGRISGNFGGQRIMNGIKKNPHSGMDIAVPEGIPVKASSDGIVTLAANDLFYSGNVIIVDHGYGLHTVYAHLKEISVKQGDSVKKGDIIALSGKTGRVTGPHLHWGASYNGIKFNPKSLLSLGKSNDLCFNL